MFKYITDDGFSVFVSRIDEHLCRVYIREAAASALPVVICNNDEWIIISDWCSIHIGKLNDSMGIFIFNFPRSPIISSWFCYIYFIFNSINNIKIIGPEIAI